MILKKILLDYENIIFDCDGVILDSNKIKTNSFIKLFENYPKDKIDQMVDYHIKYGGVSRYKKISYFFNILLNKNLSEIDLKSYAKNYSKISLIELKKANFIPGLLDLLIYLKHKKKKLFVVSGSDEKDLIQILKYKKIDNYFEKIKGSPKNKNDNLIDLLPDSKDRKKSVYIGDSNYDFITSQNLGIKFIFISGYSEWKVSKNFLKKNKILNSKDFIHH